MNRTVFIIVMVYVVIQTFKYWLEYLNITHAHRHSGDIPTDFEGTLDHALLLRMDAYLAEKTRFGMVTAILSSCALLVFLLAGVLDRYNTWIASLGLSFIPSGWIFFLLLFVAVEALSVPTGLYFTFKIENKYGFNRTTYGLWLADFLKSIVLSAVLLSTVVLAGLWLIETSPHFWWLWFWCFSLAFTLFVTYVSPYVIEPLFNKFTPVDDLTFRERIVQLARKAGINVSKVLTMDASKRSGHTNAYFTGIGRTKRIILFDTLLTSMGAEEILAVLAHEIGHWKRHHLLKGLAATQLLSLVILFLAYRLIHGSLLTELFKLGTDTVWAKIVIAGFLISLATFLLKPVMNGFTRMMEREADRFSCDLEGRGETMITVLVKLSKDNLSNLFPHPLYALFEYSHPPVLERIEFIRKYCAGKSAK
jgi:STE24 endopeptidase